MDPLLRQLQSLSIGASVNNMYAGGFLHADDIRTLAANASTLEAQISTVKRFTQDNFLKLNAAKCEIIVFKKSFIRNTEESLDVGEISFPVRSEAMCLGHQWRQDLSSSCAIRDLIKRVGKAYFQFGSVYAFQGKRS